MSPSKHRIIEAARSSILSIKGVLLRSLAVAIPSLLLAPLAAHAGSYSIPVGSGVYEGLEMLEAEGLITSGLLANRPIARNEATRLLIEAVDSTAYSNAGQGARASIRRLRLELGEDYGAETYFKPFERITFKYAYSDGAPQYLNRNNMGDTLLEGSNLRAGFSAHARLLDKASFYINPELRYSAGGEGDADVEIVEGYASLTLWNIELTAGRQALWWGPGEHGTLLLTDNAQPFDLIKITNPTPVLLPWVFKYMGPMRLTAFAARLEDKRTISRPYLAGMRLDLKPSPYMEIGLSRVAMFGGGGRKVDAGTFWDVFTARNENTAGSEPGNQLASIDLKLIVPWRVQPFTLYAEAGAEDMYLPALGAYMAGAYLPRILGLESLSARVEYADNNVAGHPRMWYQHHLYTTGYTYRGRVIGHHMGTDAHDLFLKLRYRHGSWMVIQAEADFERSDINTASPVKRSWYGADMELTVTDGLRVGAGGGYERIDPTGASASSTPSAWLRLEYIL